MQVLHAQGFAMRLGGQGLLGLHPLNGHLDMIGIPAGQNRVGLRGHKTALPVHHDSGPHLIGVPWIDGVAGVVEGERDWYLASQGRDDLAGDIGCRCILPRYVFKRQVNRGVGRQGDALPVRHLAGDASGACVVTAPGAAEIALVAFQDQGCVREGLNGQARLKRFGIAFGVGGHHQTTVFPRPRQTMHGVNADKTEPAVVVEADPLCLIRVIGDGSDPGSHQTIRHFRGGCLINRPASG